MTWGQLLFLIAALPTALSVSWQFTPCRPCEQGETNEQTLEIEAVQEAETAQIEVAPVEDSEKVVATTNPTDEVLEPAPLWNPVTVWVYDSKTGEPFVQSFSGDRLPRASGKHRLVAQWGEYEQ